MHPQHIQPFSALHLPLVTAMTGQVKVVVCKCTQIQPHQDDVMQPPTTPTTGKSKGRSSTPSELQGPLLSILAHYPTTADSAYSCLLCCQPEPFPKPLAARAALSTQGGPCRPAAWQGQQYQHRPKQDLTAVPSTS